MAKRAFAVLEIRLLGQFELRIDGAVQALPSRPAQSLLAYLALHAGAAQRRERLAGLLWPDHSEISARRNLRTALWHVRKVLGDGKEGAVQYIQSDGITSAFNVESPYWLDTAAFEKPVDADCASAELVERVSLYRGELLPGFYDDWVVLERDRLEAVFEATIEQLLHLLLAEARWHDALTWAGRWIAFGRAPEPAYRAQMTAHAGLGDLPSMAEAYDRCQAALREDLGVAPSAPTVALYQALIRGESPADALPRPARPPRRPGVTPGPAAAPAPGEPPFRGLRHFEEADAPIFFGREALIAKLVDRLSADPGLLVIVGASGSGKSSLLRAGLIPALKDAARANAPAGPRGWQVHLITPGAHPLEAMAASLTPGAASPRATAELVDLMQAEPRSLARAIGRLRPGGSQRILLAVDQFEELFTLCRSDAEGRAFVENLIVASGAGMPLSVIIALRADFYAHCGQYPALREALAAHQEYIGPMNAEELRRAIEGPAEWGGWHFGPELVDLMLRDAGEEPGSLPLLSHALLETWKRREGRTLTLTGYATSGGVRGAIARTAERVYQGLAPGEQALARSIFLRLTALGDGTQDTRRRTELSELIPSPELIPLVRDVLAALVDARLITTGDDGVEVAHEALIREWPTLRRWLAEDREGLRLHRRLTAAAQEWEVLDRDPSLLYRGMRLQQAVEWAGAHGEQLNAVERAFLQSAREHASSEAAEREAQLQREIAAREQAEQQRRLATSRELAAAAITSLETDPERSILLAVEAVNATYRVDRMATGEAETALHQALARSRLITTLRPGSALFKVRYSPDGQHFGLVSHEMVAIWERATGKPAYTLEDQTGYPSSIDFSADGARIVTADTSNIIVWDVSGAPRVAIETRVPVLGAHAKRVENAVIDPKGGLVATAGDDGQVILWDLRSGEALHRFSSITGATHSYALAFSPDGRLLACGGAENTARIYDVVTGDRRAVLRGHTDMVASVAFSPDGTRVATGGTSDSMAKIWDMATGQESVSLVNHTNIIWDVMFNPDGTQVLTASFDGTARVWDAASGREMFTLAGHEAAVQSASFSPDGREVVTASEDGTARIWSVRKPAELGAIEAHTGMAFAIALSPDNKLAATAGQDGMVRVWDVATGHQALALCPDTNRVPQFSVAFSPDGRRLATAGQALIAQVWDLTTGELVLALEGHAGPLEPGEWLFRGIRSITYSPDGTSLATAAADGTARIWDASTGSQQKVLRGHAARLNAVRFSPDGEWVATGSDDGTAVVWDVANGDPIWTLRGHKTRVWAAEFSRDGKRLATGGRDSIVRIWNTANGREVLSLTGHRGTVNGLAFSPDGKRLASSGSDSAVHLWDMANGQELFALPVANASVWSPVFSSDGTRLFAVTSEGLALGFTLQLDELIRLARARVTRGLTDAECRKYLHTEVCPPADH